MLASLLLMPVGSAAPRVPDEYRVGGFVLGPQVYSFRFFTLFEAIEKAAQTGGRAIELGRNLKVSPLHPISFNHEAPAEHIPLVQEKLKPMAACATLPLTGGGELRGEGMIGAWRRSGRRR